MFPLARIKSCTALPWYRPSFLLFFCMFLHSRGTVASSATAKCAASSNEECERNYIKDMYMMELVEIFGANHADNVPSFSLAKVDGLDNIKHGIEKDQKFVIKTMGKQYKVTVRPNRITFPDHHMTEYHDETGPVEKYKGIGVGAFTRGEIENDELSQVNLHHSGKGISGSLHTANEAFIIKPLPLRMQDDKADHVVYSLADSPAQEQMKKYFKIMNNTISKRSAHSDLPKKTVEVLMVADWKMLQFYTKDLLEQYILDLANVIAGLFRDPSLEYPLDFVLVRKVIWKTDRMQASGTYPLLANFQKWYAKWNPTDDADPKHADIGILVHRNGCIPSGCDIEGLANSINCSPQSVATARDRGLGSATSFAHETAHVLGAHHDRSAECPTGTFIMSFNGARGGPRALKFTPCSSRSIKRGLINSKCYDDVPETKLTDSTYQLYGQKLDMARQCEYLYGPQYRKCPINFANPCYSLYCQKKAGGSCKSMFFPALHGTNCGQGKWCIFGSCVPDGSPVPPKPPVVDGYWSSWSDFTACNKPCGVGLRWKTRTCNNPEPRNGGKWCDPWATKREPQYGHEETCNTQNCMKPNKVNVQYPSGTLHGSIQKDRVKQCKAKGYRTAMKIKFVRGACDLQCGPSGLSGMHVGRVTDGTGCKLKGKKHKKKKGVAKRLGVCFRGACKEYGCNFVLHSDIENDRCNICGGNGTTCRVVNYKYKVTYKPDFHNRMKPKKILTLPKGLMYVNIKEVKASWLNLGWGFTKQNKAKIMGPSSKKKFTKNKVNMKFTLKRRGKDHIQSTGALGRSIDIYLKNRYRKKSKGIMINYLKNLKTPDPLGKTMWKIKKWEPCSHSCGGDGVQQRHTYCIRKDDKTPIHTAACKQAKPRTIQMCNRKDCPATWIVSKWTACTKTCASGNQTRTIKCIALDGNGHQNEVSADKCSGRKPGGSVVRTCNAVECPARWEIKSEWTQCSRSCGGGRTFRNVECWMISSRGVDSKRSDLSCAGVVLQKPSDDDVCNDDEPCPHWNILHTDCSKSCGAGTYKEYIVCESEVSIFGPSKCNAAKKPVLDAAVVPCNLGPCMPGKWAQIQGICTKSCGGGEMSITVECQSEANGKKIDESQCDPNRRPHVLWGTCNIDECPMETEWRSHNSLCSKTCGNGTITTTPSCENKKTHEKLDERDCDMFHKPAVRRHPCNVANCSLLIDQLEYHWERRWGECPVTCGEGVERTVSVCVRKYGHKDVDPFYCKDQTPPRNESRPCNFGECLEDEEHSFYSWHIRDYGCGFLCGNGHHELQISCLKRHEHDDHFHITNPEHCNQNEKPEHIHKTCKNLPPCPTKYELKIHHGICDALCGHGHKVRTLKCFENHVRVDFDNCHSLLSRDSLHPHMCAATRKCDPHKPTPHLPPLIEMGCWEDGDSADLPLPVGKSPKEAEEEASARFDLKIRSCALSAEKKFEMIFGVDEEGNCLGVKDSQMHASKEDFVKTCSLTNGPSRKYFIYKFFVWH